MSAAPLEGVFELSTYTALNERNELAREEFTPFRGHCRRGKVLDWVKHDRVFGLEVMHIQP